MSESSGKPVLKRIATGLPGLDTVLHGGLIPAAVYIVQGSPGAGKTILANQLCFHHAARGAASLYITLLAESHDRLIEHLRSLDYFDEEQVPSSIYYESAFATLEAEGLEGILRLLTRERKARNPAVIILDGLFVLEESVHSEAEFRKFVNSLSTFASLTDTTILLLTNSARSPRSPEYTMVDGWIELGMQQVDYQSYRYLQVHKFRGSGFVSGRHMTAISGVGMEVFPRLESTVGRASGASGASGDGSMLTTGIGELDRMMGGGVRQGSATLLVGPSGIGKTTFGLEFIGASTPAEPGLIFTFYEHERDLVEKAHVLGIDLGSLVRDGAVEVLWQPSTENALDQLGYALLAAVRARGVKRLLVDGINGLRQSVEHPARVGRFFAALSNALRAEGVTTIYTLETEELIGGETQLKFGSISATAQNILLLRYVELADEACRTLAIVKVRSSAFDAGFRRFCITGDGVVIGERFRHVEDVMTGHAHRRSTEGDC